MPGMKVRNADKEDLFEVGQLALSLGKETGLKAKLGWDWKHVLLLLEEMVHSGLHTVIVTEEDGDIVGFLAGGVAPSFMNPLNSVVGAEMGWYVKPEYRGSSAGIRMMKAFEAWCKEAGATHVTMMHLETPQSNKIASAYENLGYDKFETAYIKEL